MDLFHDGDIQSGIKTALEQDKCVVCFIKDDTAESEQWLEWLQDHHIPSHLQKNAITLKIQHGSAEADALNTFAPISRVPMLSVIYKGTVLDQLVIGITKNEFTLRLLRATSPSQRAQTVNNAPAGPGVPTTSQTTTELRTVTSEPPGITSTPPAAQNPLETPTSEARLETTRESKPSKGKGKATDGPSRNDQAEQPSVDSDAQRYAKQNVDRKREILAEKERVRALVENDKRERKLREEQRRAARVATSSELRPEAVPGKSLSTSSTCAVRVRLLDGTTMTKTFDSAESLSASVRQWIESERTDGNLPFKLRQILTPQPSKTIRPEDEEKTLRDLGLAPSANLVLVPLKKLTAAAYPDARFGFVQGAFAKIYAFLLSVVLTIINFVRSAISTPPTARQQVSSTASGGSDREVSSATTTQNDAGPSSSGSKIRVRTLADQRENQSEDQQLYNGNQLNFEPKKDDEAKDE